MLYKSTGEEVEIGPKVASWERTKRHGAKQPELMPGLGVVIESAQSALAGRSLLSNRSNLEAGSSEMSQQQPRCGQLKKK